MRLEYTVPHQLNALHDELIAAGIHPTYIGDDPDDPDGVVIEVPDNTDPAAVEAIVNAHDKAAVEAAAEAKRTQEQQDRAAVRAFMQAANGTANNTQRDAVIKAFVRLVVGELREEDD